MMQVEVREHIYRIMPVRPGMLAEELTEREEGVIERHFEYLKDLTERGMVRLAGRTLVTDGSGFGIVILLTGDPGEAQRIMEADPAVAEGVMSGALFPFRTALTGGDAP
ncbi:MAG: YciI family protein [Candidatus Eisenbacteria bacterium]